MSNYNAQQGFSLIEMMIAITLALVLMGAALQFTLSTKRTYEVSDDISRIQENGRIALDILAKDLQMAGYRNPANMQVGGKPLFFFDDCTGSLPCTADGGGTNSDTLSIQYDPPPDDGTTPDADCQGVAVAAPATDLIVNVYTVQVVDDISSLYCRGFNATTGAWISPSDQPLVDGIDNMQVLYRVTTPATPSTPASHFYASYDRLTDTDKPNITAARVALLVSNGLADGFADSKIRRYQVLDSGTITYDSSLNPPFDSDRQPRRIYSTTVQFNNRTF
jgi:type IV pilus assembly protein PilW